MCHLGRFPREFDHFVLFLSVMDAKELVSFASMKDFSL